MLGARLLARGLLRCSTVQSVPHCSEKGRADFSEAGADNPSTPQGLLLTIIRDAKQRPLTQENVSPNRACTNTQHRRQGGRQGGTHIFNVCRPCLCSCCGKLRHWLCLKAKAEGRLFFFLVCVCTHWENPCICVCACVWRPEDLRSCSPGGAIHLGLFETGFLLPTELDWLAREAQGSTHLCFLSTGLQEQASTLRFF